MIAFGDQLGIPCVLMRGGTSKAAFFHARDLPPMGASRDSLLARLIGNGDPSQIDGLGGARLNTSKVAIIAPSSHADADVDYTFVQVGVDFEGVSHDGNCGNISSAVGAFAIDEQLVPTTAALTVVRIHNTNTGAVLRAQVPVAQGRAAATGECAIAGVPGKGAQVLMDYSGSVGALTGHLLPTGLVREDIVLDSGVHIEVTLCDAGNPCIFVAAPSLGMSGRETPEEVESACSQEALQELRAKAGVRMGLWADWRMDRPPVIPLLVIVSKPASHETFDVMTRLMYGTACHTSIAATGAICTAAAARVAGSVVAMHSAPDEGRDVSEEFNVGHPSGATTVLARASGDPLNLRFDLLGFARTARRIMAGTVFVPESVEHAKRRTS